MSQIYFSALLITMTLVIGSSDLSHQNGQKNNLTNMNKAIYKIGFCSGLVAFTSTVVYDVVQMLQVYRVLTRPWDGILIYGFSLCIVIPFVFEILALHYVSTSLNAMQLCYLLCQ
jgi:hypothetical protein